MMKSNKSFIKNNTIIFYDSVGFVQIDLKLKRMYFLLNAYGLMYCIWMDGQEIPLVHYDARVGAF